MTKAAEPCYDTDLATSHGCQYIGMGTESNGDIFDLYHDPRTGFVFKVVSDFDIDTIILLPEGEKL